MADWPFRFVHAGDFHLELPVHGLADVPDHLRNRLLDAPFAAAERVFETTLSEEAQFLVLSGDLLDPNRTGPRGVLFLTEQFARLAEREIPIFWAGGRVDPADAWPAGAVLPDNVHVFPEGLPQDHLVERDGVPLVRLVGASRMARRGVRIAQFDSDPAGLFSVGAFHGRADAEKLKSRPIDYWALGGCHARGSLFNAPTVAHYPGTPQGREPNEAGPHGCTLVQVDPQRRVRTTLVSTDVVRWHNERIAIDEKDTRHDLESRLHGRIQDLIQAAPGIDLLIAWNVAGHGRLMNDLRRAGLADEILELLRRQYGYGPATAWSASIAVEPAVVVPAEWFEHESIRGDFLREIRHYQQHAGESLDLEAFLSEPQLAGALSAAADLSDPSTRERVLREAALLGIDLLSGEEPQS
jgi:hypothetical protein